MKYMECKRPNKETGQMEKDIIINGTTTIVYGKGAADKHLTQEATLKLLTVGKLLGGLIFHGPEAKGVAKLSPEDTYDKMTGIKIASRKAELKVRIKMHNAYATALNLLKEVADALETEETKIDERISKICDELNIEVAGTNETEAKA